VHNFLNFSDLIQYNAIFNSDSKLLDLVLGNVDCTVSHNNNPFVKEDRYHPALEVDVLLHFEKYYNFPVHNTQNSKQYNFKKANFPLLYEYESLQQIACKMFYDKLYSTFDI
ncbi:unnamed protein product, partial [Brassicogethes aeneus]